MIVDMNKQGVVTLTAENAEENKALFDLANEYNFKAQTKFEPEAPKAKKKYTYKKRPVQYHKSCPVEGCDHKAKSIDMHLRLKHGIMPDGSLKNTFTYNGASRSGAGKPEERPISMPVVKKSEGGYRLKDMPREKSEGLLGHTDTFSRSRILN